MSNSTRRPTWLTILALLIFVVRASAAAQSVSVGKLTTINSTGLTATGQMVQDTCGNLYLSATYPVYAVFEIPASGGAPSQLALSGSATTKETEGGGIAIDGNNTLYLSSYQWDGLLLKIPSVNCVPQASQAVEFASPGSAEGYWYSPSTLVTDVAGDLFIATYQNMILEYSTSGVLSVLYTYSTTDKDTGIQLAIDANGDLFYTLDSSDIPSGTIYELADSAGTYAKYPTMIATGIVNAGGLTFDANGNLYVIDTKTNILYEILYDVDTASLNPGSLFPVAASPNAQNYPISTAKDGKSILYASANNSLYELIPGSPNFGSVSISTNAIALVNFSFNSAMTPAAVTVLPNNGAFSNTGTGTCQANSYTANSNCTVGVSFTPTIPGVTYGSVVLTDANGVALATADISGTGSGAGLTVDPGVVSTFSSGFSAPTGAAIDNQGNLFFADSKLNEVLEVPAGASSAAAVSIASGFSAPTGVAVDGAGNVYVADTGNNQIVEIPFVNGAFATPSPLISSSTTVAGKTLSSPAGVTVDSLGNLYIADGENGRVVYLPYVGSWDFSLAVTIGSGMTSPSAIAVDALGNVYVADAGNGNVYELTAPLNAGAQATVASNLSAPSALAVDASGAVFVVDQGNAKVWRIPNNAGSPDQADAVNVIGQLNADETAIIQAPYGVAIDPIGNLYVSDDKDAAAYIVSRTSSTQSFGQWNPGQTSGILLYDVENSGNTALTLGSPYYTVTGDTTQFQPLTSETGACASGASVVSGSSCSLESEFMPSTGGSYSETYTLSSNAANVSAPQLIFTGSGGSTLPTTTTLAVTSPSGNPSYDQSITLTATVTATGTSTPVGVGAVNLVNASTGAIMQTVSLTNGAATFTLAGGGPLSGGALSLSASYTGGISGNSAYEQSTSTPATTVNIQPVASSTALSFTTIYPTPPSQPAGTPIDLFATVSSTFAGATTGTVTFIITDSDGTQVPPLTVNLAAFGTGGKYQAEYPSFKPSAPANGAAYSVISVVATYNGNADFAASSSAAGTFNVSPAIGSVSVTSSGSSITGTPLTSGKNGDGTIIFTSTSYGGWEGVVGFQCDPSTLPANAICVFSPGQVAAQPNTVSNPYPPATTQLEVVVSNPPNSPLQSTIPWWLGGIAGLSLLLTRRRWMRGAWGTAAMLVATVLVAFSAGGILACAGGGIEFPTPSGTSTITVIADSDPYLVPPPASTVTVQPCGGIIAGSNPPKGNPADTPCAQATFQVTLTVK